MQIVKDKISINKLKQMAEKSFGNLVKAVVDVEKKIMVVDADLHSDQEELLLKQGSYAPGPDRDVRLICGLPACHLHGAHSSNGIGSDRHSGQ